MSTRSKVSISAIVAIVGLLSGWMLSGCEAFAQTEHRLSVIETKEDHHTDEFKALRDDIKEIRDDVKRLLEGRDR